MRRVERWFVIVHRLGQRERVAAGGRDGPRPATAWELAKLLVVSERTVYRDIAELIAMGAPIRGEPGFGYLLARPWQLPPIERLVDVLRETLRHGTSDDDAASTLAKRAVRDASGAPADEREAGQGARAANGDGLRARARRSTGDLVGTTSAPAAPMLSAAADEREARARLEPRARDVRVAAGEAPLDASEPMVDASDARVDIDSLRRAIAAQRKLLVTYAALPTHETTRLIRPLALHPWGTRVMLLAWCELREGYRSFRLDRLRAVIVTDERFGDDDAHAPRPPPPTP